MSQEDGKIKNEMGVMDDGMAAICQVHFTKCMLPSTTQAVKCGRNLKLEMRCRDQDSITKLSPVGIKIAKVL